MDSVRVRIAPSPSGFLHIGTAKMALFNWLVARHTGGAFILRLEDTDAERTDEAFVHAMCEGFQWLGIDWDEGPAFGDEPEKGAYGPYRQSQRKELHQREAHRLLAEGKAYKCFLTKEELEEERNRCRAESRPLRSKWRDATPEEVATMGDTPFAVRFRVPEGETVINDLVQGEVRINHNQIDDFVILKPNGDPIFHLAVVVDDGTMKITHVIRGDDHLTNTPRHVMLFEALGYPVPAFAHLPMVLDERGKKYSKRDRGANVLDWRDDGYLAEALINYVVLLGWSPGDDRVLFSRDELVNEVTIDRFGQSAARFDLKKLQWLNGQHIRLLSPEDLCDRLTPILETAGFDLSERSRDWLLQMTLICQEKLATLNDIVEQTDFFFVAPTEYEEKAVKKHWQKDDAAIILEQLLAAVANVEPWSHDDLKEAFKKLAENAGVGLGQLIHPTRLALTGKSVGPGLFELAELLGKDVCVNRMERALAYVRDLQESAS